MLIKIKRKLKKLYKNYIKGNIQNIVLVVCISGFMFGFFMGYILTESEKMEMAQNEETSSEKIKEMTNEDRIIDISKRVSPSVVVVKNKIYVNKGDEKVLADRGIGSGIIYHKDGYIITNQHVVRDASKVTVVLEGKVEYDGEIVGEDEKTDLAVIKINKEFLKAADFGDSENLKVGESVVAIGSPLGEEFSGTVTSGIISSTERNLKLENRNAKLIQTDTAINPGNSGGALVNKNGEVIGINSLKISSAQVEGMAFAIPINTAKTIVDEIIESGFVKRAWLGLGLKDIKSPEGIYVGEIMKKGPADNGEIVEGDIIIKVGDTKVKSISELSSIIENHLPNDLVDLTIIRNNKELNKKITLGETSKSSPF